MKATEKTQEIKLEDLKRELLIKVKDFSYKSFNYIDLDVVKTYLECNGKKWIRS